MIASYAGDTRVLVYAHCGRKHILPCVDADDDHFADIDFETLPNYFLFTFFLLQSLKLNYYFLFHLQQHICPFSQLYQLPSLRPHLVEHLRVSLHSLIDPSLKQQHLLHTDTSAAYITLSKSTALDPPLQLCRLRWQPTRTQTFLSEVYLSWVGRQDKVQVLSWSAAIFCRNMRYICDRFVYSQTFFYDCLNTVICLILVSIIYAYNKACW